jgi:hypothetical protein
MLARRDLIPSGTSRVHSQDGTAWRHLDGGNAPAIEHYEPVTMARAKHTRVLRKRFDDSFDDLVLIDLMVLIPEIESVTAHEPDPQNNLSHTQAH